MGRFSNDRSAIKKEVKKRYEAFFAGIPILIDDHVFFAIHFTKFVDKIFVDRVYYESDHKVVAHFLRVLIGG